MNAQFVPNFGPFIVLCWSGSPSRSRCSSPSPAAAGCLTNRDVLENVHSARRDHSNGGERDHRLHHHHHLRPAREHGNVRR
jgi:hypothetical protein